VPAAQIRGVGGIRDALATAAAQARSGPDGPDLGSLGRGLGGSGRSLQVVWPLPATPACVALGSGFSDALALRCGWSGAAARAGSPRLPQGPWWPEFIALEPLCTYSTLAGPSRSLLGVLGTPAVVVDVLLLVDKLPSAAVFSMHATTCLRFAGVRSPARVKTLLGVADADHGDTCGCHSLLGGVFLGQRRPSPLFVPGETLGPLLDQPAVALRRRPLLEGAVLA
jgi:hypothetical protein